MYLRSCGDQGTLLNNACAHTAIRGSYRMSFVIALPLVPHSLIRSILRYLSFYHPCAVSIIGLAIIHHNESFSRIRLVQGQHASNQTLWTLRLLSFYRGRYLMHCCIWCINVTMDPHRPCRFLHLYHNVIFALNCCKSVACFRKPWALITHP